jgi:hypothetical protein
MFFHYRLNRKRNATLKREGNHYILVGRLKGHFFLNDNLLEQLLAKINTGNQIS